MKISFRDILTEADRVQFVEERPRLVYTATSSAAINRNDLKLAKNMASETKREYLFALIDRFCPSKGRVLGFINSALKALVPPSYHPKYESTKVTVDLRRKWHERIPKKFRRIYSI